MMKHQAEYDIQNPLGGIKSHEGTNEEKSVMKQNACICIIALLSILFTASISPAGELDEHLQCLNPLLGKTWVGGYTGSDSPDIEIVLRFETILAGRAVKYVREADAVDFSSLTHFFWDPGREEIRFIGLNNKGMVEEGVVHAMDGKIVLTGKSHRPDTSIEFKTILETDPSGNLRDTFQRVEDGKWVQGHIQQFVVRK
jgi:hypothetical protein